MIHLHLDEGAICILAMVVLYILLCLSDAIIGWLKNCFRRKKE